MIRSTKTYAIIGVVILVSVVVWIFSIKSGFMNAATFFKGEADRNLEDIAKKLNEGRQNMSSEDHVRIESLLTALPPAKRNVANAAIAFAARGKRVSLEEIEKFETAATQIKEGRQETLLSSIKTTGNLNNLKAANGQNLLMFALGVNASRDILNLLLESGIDVNAVDDQGKTAAHLVLDWGASSKETIEFLKSNGANLKIKDKNGISADDILKVRN